MGNTTAEALHLMLRITVQSSKLMGMLGKVTPEALGEEIAKVAADETMHSKAKALGEQVKAEDGIGNAIKFIDEMASSYAYPWPVEKAAAPLL